MSRRCRAYLRAGFTRRVHKPSDRAVVYHQGWRGAGALVPRGPRFDPREPSGLRRGPQLAEMVRNPRWLPSSKTCSDYGSLAHPRRRTRTRSGKHTPGRSEHVLRERHGRRNSSSREVLRRPCEPERSVSVDDGLRPGPLQRTRLRSRAPFRRFRRPRRCPRRAAWRCRSRCRRPLECRVRGRRWWRGCICHRHR